MNKYKLGDRIEYEYEVRNSHTMEKTAVITSIYYDITGQVRYNTSIDETQIINLISKGDKRAK